MQGALDVEAEACAAAPVRSCWEEDMFNFSGAQDFSTQYLRKAFI